ncbi:glycogen debranching protein [Myxococcus llanfairpwllgwyngyllgogerychwyrndrobwllllantysiliogogogochensis]|uniref:Glycogen debranching protein n=1 Tax=Myxococcus llanfairpwllgwyngyllgogerychwyrndrobwllllantysiliogogogochensis TaxID=2590453 RepID=A0A540X3S6_9BACT|nr:amylo-alpha-1,6-glucosidase [Myxococcus llanfairpwllgwyngyllgogerychwyrndrobwllllantysiliogogogochensis]TQF15883.1 glycogen debranching protein [Myxococcus llanfairpwllgwyngyllgogerychwyrndrobwllllantysiliogogogochensis]
MSRVRGLPELKFAWPMGAPAIEVLGREWLMTNGLGGYASGTLAGVNARRYHGLFIPTLPERGRTVMLSRLVETARVEGQTCRLDGEVRADGALMGDASLLRSFRLDGLIPEWDYVLGASRLRRRLVLVHGENTLFIEWAHLSGPPVKLRLRPFPVFRVHEHDFPHDYCQPKVILQGERIEMQAAKDAPSLRLRLYGDGTVPFVAMPEISSPLLYRTERSRGMPHIETQASPGYFECTVRPGGRLSLGATVDDWALLDRDPSMSFDMEREREWRLLERAPVAARTGTAARLVLAGDQFIVDPMRPRDDAWARAIGEDARSVIAGYPWFTDWGRDTMISLEGLTVSTGRFREAAAILRTFRHHVKDGLLPNLFPEGEADGLYHTADATLWFFHAVDRYVTASGDLELLREFYPTFEDIVRRHQQGTRHNIRIDPTDGLLTQGEEGYQLTWMDAKVDGWVVTPRRGKAVELNALWFNAMRLMAEWAALQGLDGTPYAMAAQQAQDSFNRRFWNPAEGCLFDVVDAQGGGNDAAVRPNQIFALSLKYPVLNPDHWSDVLRKVETELLTPVGLRSLASDHDDYKATYDGDLRARDAAYHQGTVWSWLIGHYVDAALRVQPARAHVRDVMEGLETHLRQAGVGQVSEIFDATPPFRPRGCIAQAWGVAEALRVFLRTA